MKLKTGISLFLIWLLLIGCTQNGTTPQEPVTLTIFYINDPHAQIDNFAKVKDIVDKERAQNPVLVVSSGDIFSGNPVVDQYPEKGYPMIDLMNRVGFDVAVLGNHEYDYGQEVLKARMAQATFSWVCANIDMSLSGLPGPDAYKTVEAGDLRISFLGLVETNGKIDDIIPSTHPWRVENFVFERPETVVGRYANTKTEEDADLFIALSHLGFDMGDYALGDVQLAERFPYFDLIIGGHSHQRINTTINGIPIYQSGSYLRNLGKIKLTIKDKTIIESNYELIDLSAYPDEDAELVELIKDYNNLPSLEEVVGYSAIYHDRTQLGCFITDALKGEMQVDVAFQNGGGIRSSLAQGDITKRNIYEMNPFNNGTVIYSMTVQEIKNFLIGSGSGFFYAGIDISQSGPEIIIKDTNGVVLPETQVLTVGVLDYVAAVNDQFFPKNGVIQPKNDVETIIAYLQTKNRVVDYPNCNRYFGYQD